MDMVEVDKNNLRTIEITINYHELLMKYDDTSVYKKYDLPEAFIMNFINLVMKKNGLKYI